MKIKFLGAAGTVTGSGYLLTCNSGQQILIDLGMFQGLPSLEELNYSPIQLDARNLAGILLTHAHMDHCGRLPMVEILGFGHCNVFMTAPTIELTKLTLTDSARIGKIEHPERILYSQKEVESLARKFASVNYDEKFKIGDFEITFRDAGHILGSASIEISVDGQKVVFSGDLGNSPEDLVKPTEQIESGEIVIMESTYGDRLHPSEQPKEMIAKEVLAIEANKGTLLIPAFSLERTQELLHIFSHLKSQNTISPDTSVILDSPMAEKATVIYEKYRQFLNPELNNDFRMGNPFDFPGFLEIRDPKKSRNIYKIPGPKVIIAGGGMMTGGRIIEHARNYLAKSNTRLLIVGFQGEGTLGRELLERKRIVRINNQQIQVSASISDTQAMSSHADQNKLMKWLNNIQGVKRLILTHGEDTPRKILADKIISETEIRIIDQPKLNQELII